MNFVNVEKNLTNNFTQKKFCSKKLKNISPCQITVSTNPAGSLWNQKPSKLFNQFHASTKRSLRSLKKFAEFSSTHKSSRKTLMLVSKFLHFFFLVQQKFGFNELLFFFYVVLIFYWILLQPEIFIYLSTQENSQRIL